MFKLFVTISFVLLVPILFVSIWKTKNTLPQLFRQPAQIVSELLARNAAQCTLSGSTPEGGIVGLSYHTIAGEDRQQEYEALADLGVKHVRIDFGWKFIEREDGTYDWTGQDVLIEELTKRGILVSDATIVHIPNSLETWEDAAERLEKFMSILVLRYKPGGVYAEAHPEFPGIRYWEIFNEPNLPGLGFLPKNVSPQNFVDGYIFLLASANRAIHQADPQAFVIAGGLSSDGAPPEEFFTRIVTLAPNCFDIAAFHPYGPPEQFRTVAERYRNIMLKYGVGNRQLWFNEYGTDSSDEYRSEILPVAFFESKLVDGFFWFTLRDLARTSEQYGVLNYDYTKKSTYEILKLMFRSNPKK